MVVQQSNANKLNRGLIEIFVPLNLGNRSGIVITRSHITFYFSCQRQRRVVGVKRAKRPTVSWPLVLLTCEQMTHVLTLISKVILIYF